MDDQDKTIDELEAEIDQLIKELDDLDQNDIEKRAEINDRISQLKGQLSILKVHEWLKDI